MRKATTSSTLLRRLQEALTSRDIRTGFSLLDNTVGKTEKLDYSSSDAISLLLCVAQWIDLGYKDLSFLDRLLNQSPQTSLQDTSIVNFLKLKMVEAFKYLTIENLEEVITLLDLVIRVSEMLAFRDLLFLANFWKGRAHRKRGDYERALFHISAARANAEEARATKLVAVTKIHESWLVFQKGEHRYAFQLLDEAEVELKPTGHALSLGNIESARGRFVRRSGEYTRALSHFERAITVYTENFPHHPNLARALVNAAYVKRLIALDLRPKKASRRALGATHARSLQISKEALDLLQKAADIYSLHQHQGGTGSVLVNSAHIHLESGDIDQASTEAQRAFALGRKNNDQILMSRARSAQALVELASSEEELGELPDIALHANLAIKYADEAIELAQHTQNKRLLAEAYIARGLAATDDFWQSWEVAKDYSTKATALLSENDRDHLFKELSRLKSKTLASTGIEETLRLWSEGQSGNKTFQQIQEEFAELMIPKVWINVGRNVTLVARKLSISPKKVRRILRNAKHVDISEPHP